MTSAEVMDVRDKEKEEVVAKEISFVKLPPLIFIVFSVEEGENESDVGFSN
jgi:hypothetical protein